VSLPYTAGSGTVYTTTTVTNAGLTLTRVAGTYNVGGGNVVYNIGGTYSGALGGTAVFVLPEGCQVVAGVASITAPDCSGALAGTYEAGVALTPANTKTVNLNFVSPGNYNIGTGSINGVSFIAQGNVGSAGVQAITLIASGTPTNTGTFNYTINAGGQICSFPVTFSPAADFNCAGITGVPVVALASGVSYSATITIPYTNGNGSAYPSVAPITGGITLTRTPGTFAGAGGNVVYTMSGTSNTSLGLMWVLPESGCVITLGTIQYIGGTLSCGGALAGTYQSGSAMTAANTKTISINVSVPGIYSITTNSTNGVTFAASGTASGPGLQDIVLTAVGTPVSAGTYYYTVNVGGQACNFGVTYQ
jgi:hypothetical protein